jgi:hypothetical protein
VGQELTIPGHGQSAEIIEPKARYVREVFRNLSDDIKFEFQFLSGVLPAYIDEDDSKDQKVWGHGEPEHDKIRGLEKALEYLQYLAQDGQKFCMLKVHLWKGSLRCCGIR